MKKRFKYVKPEYRGARLYWYFRRHGERVRLSGDYGSPEFLTQYHELLGGKAGAALNAHGTVSGLIASHTSSLYWTEKIGDESRRMQMSVLKRFGRDHGTMPVRPLSKVNIEKMMALLPTLYAQRNWLIGIKPLMAHAVKLGWIEKNPCDGIRVDLPKSEGFAAWEDHQIEAYRARHAVGTMARLALELLLNTMARSGDAIKLGPRNKWNNKLRFTPRKTEGEELCPKVVLPVLPELEACIDAMPDITGYRGKRLGRRPREDQFTNRGQQELETATVSGQSKTDAQPATAGGGLSSSGTWRSRTQTATPTYLKNSEGQPFSSNVWARHFANWCKEAGLPDEYRAHGLRKAGMLKLVHAGATAPEIAACSGHASLAMVQKYIEARNKELLAERGMARLSEGA
jgi:integrase